MRNQIVRVAVLLAILPFLAGCPAHSIRSGGSIAVGGVLLARCEDPVTLPDRSLETEEVARLWSKDRYALGECRNRHAALADITRAIQGQGRE